MAGKIEKMMTVSEVAEWLKVSKPHVITLAKSGCIPSIDVGVGSQRIYRFELSKIRKALNRLP